MIKQRNLILIPTIAMAVVFFMPWVNVDVDLAKSVQGIGSKVDQATGGTGIFSKVTDTIGGAMSKAPTRKRLAAMSGFDIAKSGKHEFVNLVGELMIFIGQDAKDPRNVKYLYLVPIMGILFGIGIYKVPSKLAVTAKIIGILSAGIGGFMAYKLATVPLQNELARAELLWGIWATALMYLVIGFIGLSRR